MNLERVKKDLKETLWETSNQNNYILPDMKQIQVTRDTGYDRDALAYLYFNSDIIRDMQNSYTRPETTKNPLALKGNNNNNHVNYNTNLLSTKSAANKTISDTAGYNTNPGSYNH